METRRHTTGSRSSPYLCIGLRASLTAPTLDLCRPACANLESHMKLWHTCTQPRHETFSCFTSRNGDQVYEASPPQFLHRRPRQIGSVRAIA